MQAAFRQWLWLVPLLAAGPLLGLGQGASPRRIDAAIKASRGGGFWSRLRRRGKWFLIGGAVGAAAVAASR
jgi:hypothetical protein